MNKQKKKLVENNYQLWIKHIDRLPQWQKEILMNIQKNELANFFSKTLVFGTSGVRALVGPGISLMNEFTISQLTFQIIDYLIIKFKNKKTNIYQKGVVLICDNRKNSKQFLKIITAIFIQKGFVVYREKNCKPLPSPFASFLVKKLHALCGIVVTASHNPATYNGYKLYSDDGSLLSGEETIKLNNFILSRNDIINFKLNYDHKNIAKSSNLKKITENDENEYFQKIKKNQFLATQTKEIKIVYSNLHGTGKNFTDRLLRECGYKVINVVEQYDYDPFFSTINLPNPEFKDTFKLAIKTAKNNAAELIILNDPDADRIGVAIKNKKDSYKILTGNQLSAIILNYLIENYQQNNNNFNFKNHTVNTSYVSWDLTQKIAENVNCLVKRTFTGFKWITKEITNDIKNGYLPFFAYEEANGYLLDHTITLDKDGIQTSLLVAEMANYYKKNNLNLWDVLNKIFKKFGFYYDKTEYFQIKIKNNEDIEKTVFKIKNKLLAFKKISDFEIKKIENFEKIHKHPTFTEPLIKIYFKNNSWFAFRPSGTEQKIKFYFNFFSTKSLQEAKTKKKKVFEYIKKFFKNYLSIVAIPVEK